MRLIAIADDDSLIGRLSPGPAELLVSLGDLWDTTIQMARDRYAPGGTFAVRGNHDSAAPFAPFITPLHLVVESYAGVTFGGFNGSWRYKPRGHHLFDQEEVSSLLRDFPRVDVFIAHNSPRRHHERDEDVHQGFDAFREYIQRTQPAYFLHGHQHLNLISKIGRTTLIGVYGEIVIDLDLSPGEPGCAAAPRNSGK